MLSRGIGSGTRGRNSMGVRPHVTVDRHTAMVSGGARSKPEMVTFPGRSIRHASPSDRPPGRQYDGGFLVELPLADEGDDGVRRIDHR
jgi:hypothetical protein